MRDIKFKAKRVSDGEWVEGLYSTSTDNGETTHYIGDFNLSTPIKRHTLCQFTGLTDKNGKEGYHYDKVLSPIYGEGFIQWCNNTAGFYIDFGHEDFNSTMEHLKECEVIGNIHDK